MGWESWLEKKNLLKIKKTEKIKVKILHVNKEQLARKWIYGKTLEQKNFTPQTSRFFTPLPVSSQPKLLLQFDFKNRQKIDKNKDHCNIATLNLQLCSYNKNAAMDTLLPPILTF